MWALGSTAVIRSANQPTSAIGGERSVRFWSLTPEVRGRHVPRRDHQRAVSDEHCIYRATPGYAAWRRNRAARHRGGKGRPSLRAEAPARVELWRKPLRSLGRISTVGLYRRSSGRDRWTQHRSLLLCRKRWPLAPCLRFLCRTATGGWDTIGKARDERSGADICDSSPPHNDNRSGGVLRTAWFSGHHEERATHIIELGAA